MTRHDWYWHHSRRSPVWSLILDKIATHIGCMAFGVALVILFFWGILT